MDWIYIPLVSKALYIDLTFTVASVNHARQQPARQEQWELGVLLRDI